MTETKMVYTFERMLNAVELTGIVLVLFMAFTFQVLLHELPCPLCLLQRIGFLGMVFGFLLNLRFGLRPSHYSVVLISAIFTSFVALRQIALHIVPGTGTYGNAIFGLHLYTWSFIISMLMIIVTALQLGFDRQYQKPNGNHIYLRHGLFAVVTLLIVMNLISVLFECGIHQCPDNPVSYRWIP